MQQNKAQKNYEYSHFLHSVTKFLVVIFCKTLISITLILDHIPAFCFSLLQKELDTFHNSLLKPSFFFCNRWMAILQTIFFYVRKENYIKRKAKKWFNFCTVLLPSIIYVACITHKTMLFMNHLKITKNHLRLTWKPIEINSKITFLNTF